MRIVLLGPPGTGKGSLAFLCETRLGLVHLSPGQIFREEMARGSRLGQRVNRYVMSGRLVPDALVVQVMNARLAHARRVKKGFVLDGFPRTKGQAVGLNRVLQRLRQPLAGAVYLTSPASVLVRRLSGRRVCKRCGANYHIRTMKPKRSGRCDRCPGVLIVRKDDQPETIKKRLDVDHQVATPLVRYYRHQGLFSELNGAGHIESVFVRAMKLFRTQHWLDQ